MQIESSTLEFKNTGEFSTEHIESLISKCGKTPLRWSIVYVDTNIFKINVVTYTATN